MTFSPKPVRRALSSLALMAAIGVAGVQAPAMAQKKEKAAPAAKTSYSKEFVAAYKPIETNMKAAAPDVAAAKAAVPALVAAATTPDDKFAAGQMLYAISQKANDQALAAQGIDLVLASGKADAAQKAQFSFVGGQLAYNAKDYAKAQTLYRAAIDAGYTSTRDDPQLSLADAYIAGGQQAAGLKYLSEQIAARKAAGQPANENWYKRGLATAYNAKMNAEAQQWGLLYAGAYPTQASWGDAIAIAINTGRLQPQEMLDLLRLARRTNTLRTQGQYLEYIDAADARKLPQEVVQVIDQGVSARLLNNNQQIIKDARATAASRIASDRAELAALQRDAGLPSARLVTVMAGADTLLSYGKYAEAEALYAKAATMPGADVPLVLTRLGIAQVEQGKHAEASATFAKVSGNRKTLANLWALYATQKGAGTVIAPAPATTAAVSR